MLDADVLGDVAGPRRARPGSASRALFADDGDGHLRFRHPVVRDAAYAGLPFATRRRLHARRGRPPGARRSVTEADEPRGILSLHFSLAGDHDRT